MPRGSGTARAESESVSGLPKPFEMAAQSRPFVPAGDEADNSRIGPFNPGSTAMPWRATARGPTLHGEDVLSAPTGGLHPIQAWRNGPRTSGRQRSCSESVTANEKGRWRRPAPAGNTDELFEQRGPIGKDDGCAPERQNPPPAIIGGNV